MLGIYNISDIYTQIDKYAIFSVNSRPFLNVELFLPGREAELQYTTGIPVIVIFAFINGNYRPPIVSVWIEERKEALLDIIAVSLLVNPASFLSSILTDTFGSRH